VQQSHRKQHLPEHHIKQYQADTFQTASNLPKDTYLVADIKGLLVKDENTEYGIVDDVISTGSNDVYIVKSEGKKDILIPAIKDVVLEINIKEGYILINMPKGLID
jgi:16S rRNA processing protein RimM